MKSGVCVRSHRCVRRCPLRRPHRRRPRRRRLDLLGCRGRVRAQGLVERAEQRRERAAEPPEPRAVHLTDKTRASPTDNTS